MKKGALELLTTIYIWKQRAPYGYTWSMSIGFYLSIETLEITWRRAAPALKSNCSSQSIENQKSSAQIHNGNLRHRWNSHNVIWMTYNVRNGKLQENITICAHKDSKLSNKWGRCKMLGLLYNNRWYNRLVSFLKWHAIFHRAAASSLSEKHESLLQRELNYSNFGAWQNSRNESMPQRR